MGVSVVSRVVGHVRVFNQMQNKAESVIGLFFIAGFDRFINRPLPGAIAFIRAIFCLKFLKNTE